MSRSNYLSLDELCQLSPEELDLAARQLAAGFTRDQLQLGRVLIAMQMTQAQCDFGCSSVVHYAAAVLRQPENDARTMRRIAWHLEDLPAVAGAAEAGQVSWSALKAIVPVCEQHNEEEWLRRAQLLSGKELATLARQESLGSDEQPGPRSTELRIVMDRETTSLYAQATRSLCEELGRRLDGQEIISALCFERLTGSAFPNETTRERMQREMVRDWQADQARVEGVVAQAEHIAASAARCSARRSSSESEPMRAASGTPPRVAFSSSTAAEASRQESSRWGTSVPPTEDGSADGVSSTTDGSPRTAERPNSPRGGVGCRLE